MIWRYITVLDILHWSELLIQYRYLTVLKQGKYMLVRTVVYSNLPAPRKIPKLMEPTIDTAAAPASK